MKKLILILQIFTLVILLQGINSIEVKALPLEPNRTVTIYNLLDNGDFSDSTTFLPQGPRRDTYFEKYEPESDVVLKGGWITHFDYTGGADYALNIVDEVARSGSGSTQSKRIFKYYSPQWAIDGGYLEALPLSIDSEHRYYFTVETWADGDGSGNSDYDTNFSVTALGVDIYSSEGICAPVIPTTYTGIVTGGSGTGTIGVSYSSYCQYGCPSSEVVNADNFMLFDLTATFGDYELTEEEFNFILEDNNAPEYFTSFALTFYDPDPDGNIKTLSTMISALYEPYTFTGTEESLTGEENIISNYPILNEVQGNTIPFLANVFENYYDDFYLKDQLTFDNFVNSTNGLITPLEAEPILNTVYGNTIPNLYNVFGNYLEEFYLKTNRTYDSSIVSTFGDITSLEANPILNEVQGLTLNQSVDGSCTTLDSWSPTYSVDTLSSGILVNTGNGATDLAYTTNITSLSLNGIDDVYVKLRARVTNSDALILYLQVRDSVTGTIQNIQIINPIENKWYDLDLSGLVDVSGYSNNLTVRALHTYSDATAQNGKVMEVDYVMAIPINNTPLYNHTASEINDVIADYFEGVKYIEDFSLQSTGVNLFDVDTYNNFADYTVATYYRLEFDNLEIGKDYYVTINELQSLPTNIYMGIGNEEDLQGSNYIPFISNSVSTNVTFTATANNNHIKIYSSVSTNRDDFITNMDTYIEIQIEEGISATDYVDYNSATLTLTEDLLSVGTTIRDRAYNINDTWYKDQYVKDDYVVSTLTGVADATNVTRAYIGAFTDNVEWGTNDQNITIINVDGTQMQFTLATGYDNTNEIGKFYVGDNQYLYFIVALGTSQVDAETLLAGTQVYYALDTIVTTEIVSTGSLIQESNTTLLQLNNFATEYDIDFITSLDTTNTDYYYSESDDLLVNLDTDFGNGYEPTSEEFEVILGYLDISDYTGHFSNLEYITDFSLQSIGLNLFEPSIDYDEEFRSSTISLYGNGIRIIADGTASYCSKSFYYDVQTGEDYYFNYNSTTTGTSGGIVAIKDFYTGTTLVNIALDSGDTFTTTSDKIIIVFYANSSAVETNTVRFSNIQLEQGTTATTYVDYNSAILTLTTDLLKIKDIRDIAYNVNGNWFKDQYVQSYTLTEDDITALTVGTNIDYVSIPVVAFSGLISQTTAIDNSFLINGFPREIASGLDTIGNEGVFNTSSVTLWLAFESGNYATLAEAKTDLAGTVIYYVLDTVVTTEIVSIDSLIQESITTLVQLNNYATEYDIDFITSLDTSNTDYYYDETTDLIFDLLDSYGSGNEPTIEEFEEILYYINGGVYFDEYSDLDYVSDFALQTIGANLFDNEQDRLQGKLNTDGSFDPNYFSYYVSDYIEVNENTDYIGHSSDTSSYLFIFYDETYTYLDFGNGPFTTPENTKYVKLSVLNIGWDSFQLNVGSTVLDYSDYITPTTVTLITDLFKIGSIQDRAYSANEDLIISDNEVWYKDQYIDRDYNNILQSATGWTVGFELTNSNRFVIDLSSVLDYEVYELEEPGNINLKIGDTYYPYISLFDMTTYDGIGVATWGSSIYLRVLKSDATDVATLEVFLQANNVDFRFELATPILATEISYTGSLFQEANLTLKQIGNIPTEYQIDVMIEEPYLSTRYYEDLTEINPFYQYDDYELSVDDEPIVNLTLVETMYYQFDSYPEIYIVKYDIEGNYIADIYSNYIYDFGYIDTNRIHYFEYTLPITSAEEEMYMWIAYNGIGGTVMGAGYVAEAPSTAFNTLESGIRTVEYALGVNSTVYLDIASGYQYDHTTEDYIVDSTDPFIITHFRSNDSNSDIVFYNENTEDTYSFSLNDIQNDFSSNEIIEYKIFNSYVVFSTSNELLGSMNYLLGLDVSIDFIEDLGGTMLDYSNVFNSYNDLGVFTYNLMDGITVEAQGEAPIFYGGNPYIIDMTNHSVRYGNIVNVTLDKTSENFDYEYDNYFLYDSNSLEYFTNDFDVFAYDNILRYILYEGFAIDEATITFKAESTEDYLNGTDKSDYYIQITDTYEMRGATGIQDGVDGWLEDVGLSDSVGKSLISVITIISFTILLAKLGANFVTILVVDFGIIGLLALLGFIPLWIILFIIIIVMVLIFFTRRE